MSRVISIMWGKFSYVGIVHGVIVWGAIIQGAIVWWAIGLGGIILFPILWLETVCGILLMLDLEFTKMAFLTFEHHLYLNRPFFNILITLHDEAWVYFLKDSTSYF